MVNVCWDLDGTLTDPFEGITECIRYGLESVGCSAGEDDDLGWCIGPPLLGSFVTLTGEEEKARRALAGYRERFGSVGMFENRVYEGIVDVLSEMRGRGWKMWVVTSKPGVYAVEIIRHFGLSTFFEAVYGSELDGRFADKKELLSWVVNEEGLNINQTVMIGDRHHDYDASRHVGCRSVAVTWGYGNSTEYELADAVVDSPTLLVSRIAGLLDLS